MRRIRSGIRREIVADKNDDEGQVGREGQEGQDGREGRDEQVGQEGRDGRDGQARQDGREGQDEQDEQGQDGQVGHDEQVGQDGLEGQERQDRREALEAIPLGESLPKRAAAELKAIVEALIFASPDPLTPKAMYALLDTEPQEDVSAALAELKQDYERSGGLQLVEVAGGYQIVTRSELHEWVRRLFHERTTQKLTVQALETLAVIAYRQPTTAAEITEVRGVNTSGVLNTLLERHLIKIVGRKQVVGRPFMYATTKEFLIRFGLNDLNDLPKVEDMAEALGLDAPILVEQTPTEEMLPLDEPEGEPGGSVH
jgi:segregation and condensation protein B